jgi:hypothetical protein
MKHTSSPFSTVLIAPQAVLRAIAFCNRRTLRSFLVALPLLGVMGVPGHSVGAEARGANAKPIPKVIALRQDPSSLEWLAANEVRRYVYLRTGTLLPVERGVKEGNRIVVSRKEVKLCGDLGKELEPQQFALKTVSEGGQRVWWIVGGDEVGVLYGAYRFAETLGIHFSLEGDAVPDERLKGEWPEVNETGKPRFALRGLQPFHDFQMGPDWWNLQDYESVLTQMAKMRLNFIGLHTYPSWNKSAGPEANVWIGLPEDVDAQGNVHFGYESGVVTTRRGWSVRPFLTGNYASGAGLLFEEDDYGPDYMLDCIDWPKNGDAAAAMFNRYGDLQQKAFALARRLGIKTCVGTELSLGVAPGLAAHLESKGLKADDPAVIQRLYEGTCLRIMRKLQTDYYWFWTPESWLRRDPRSEVSKIDSAANVERDLSLIQAAARAVQAPFGLATSGWLLGVPQDPLWMDKHAPKAWAMSSINKSVGTAPVDKSYGVMPDRRKWVIGWAEDDSTSGAHCCACWDVKLFAERIFSNAADAARYGCEGMMAIHWRTAAIAPTLTALAQAGWRMDIATAPVDMQRFWSDWGQGMFGGEAGAEAGPLLQKYDGRRRGIGELINGGNHTTDAMISDYFAPISALEALRPRIQGASNLERYDYWLNLLRASKLRVQTWLQALRLKAELKEIQALPDAKEKQLQARKELLPLRLAIARNYEELIATLVASAKTAGDIGTITSIESGNRHRIVTGQDAAIAKLLGEPLPAEAAIRTAYRGQPRIFVPAPRTLAKVGEPQEVRAFVISDAACSEVSLHWRVLGADRFEKLQASHRARQAYRVSLPAQSQGCVEYYLEAVLKDGRTLCWPITAPGINQTVLSW